MLCYGLTRAQYLTEMNVSTMNGLAVHDVTDTFDHSEGRGRIATPGVGAERTPHFFTRGLGRDDEIKMQRARERSIGR